MFLTSDQFVIQIHMSGIKLSMALVFRIFPHVKLMETIVDVKKLKIQVHHTALGLQVKQFVFSGLDKDG